MATKLSDDERLFKFAARAFEKMNPDYRVKRLYPGVTVRKEKTPWLDWQALQTVDQWMLICTISFAVWALGLWEWVH